MSDETKAETTEAPAGMAALEALNETLAAEASAAPAEPKIDNSSLLRDRSPQGRRRPCVGQARHRPDEDQRQGRD